MLLAKTLTILAQNQKAKDLKEILNDLIDLAFQAALQNTLEETNNFFTLEKKRD